MQKKLVISMFKIFFFALKAHFRYSSLSSVKPRINLQLTGKISLKLDFNASWLLSSVYTWRTLTGVKLNNNCRQYSRPAIFWQFNQDTEPELH